MTRALPIILIAFCVACGDDSCPPGEMLVGAACVAVAVDGGPPPIDFCNGLDDDRDGVIDEGDPELGATCSEDVGVCTAGTLSCVDTELVCSGVLPGVESCNGLDDDCDGEVDETLLLTFYLDEDGDTFGGDMTCEACAIEECGEGNWVTVGGDCDDTCETCFEGGTEVCDGLDNDCDMEVDEDVQLTVYPDMDGDGFGTGEGTLECEVPEGFADAGGDCADEDERAFPGQTEYFETPIMGATTGPAFDFDCDGEERQLHGRCSPNPTCLNGGCYERTEPCGADNGYRATVTVMDRCVLQGVAMLRTRTACR